LITAMNERTSIEMSAMRALTVKMSVDNYLKKGKKK